MWETKKLGEVCEKTETINPTNKPNDEFTYIDVSSVSKETLKIEETQRLIGRDAPSRARRGVRENDVIFATIRPTLQRVACVPTELDGQICSTGYIVLRPKPQLHYRYLFYWLTSKAFINRMGELQTGASYPAVTDKQVKEQSISFPSLSEQQRIVAKLDAAFAEIDRAIDANNDSLANSEKMFEVRRNDIYLGLMSSSPIRKLGEIADLSRGHNPPKSTFSNEPKPGYVRFYQIRDAKSDKFATYVPQSNKLHMAGEEDFLMNAYRYIGEVYRGVTGAFNVALCKLSIKDKMETDSEYLFHMIPSKLIKGELLKISARSLIPSMSVKELAVLKIPVPPIDVQVEIAGNVSQLLEEITNLTSLYAEKRDGLEKLKSAILAQELRSEAA